MPGCRIWYFRNKEDAVSMASLRRRKAPTYGFLVIKPPQCWGWRIAIYDTYTGQFVDWLKA